MVDETGVLFVYVETEEHIHQTSWKVETNVVGQKRSADVAIHGMKDCSNIISVAPIHDNACTILMKSSRGYSFSSLSAHSFLSVYDMKFSRQ
jgi:hypothetical protein